jgi:hypothetical protein
VSKVLAVLVPGRFYDDNITHVIILRRSACSKKLYDYVAPQFFAVFFLSLFWRSSLKRGGLCVFLRVMCRSYAT